MGRTLFVVASLSLLLMWALPAGEVTQPEWPDPSKFTPGQTTEFRLPFFAGLLTYGDDTRPLYNVLHVPAGYDPNRSYPLMIRFQPQGGKPSTYDLGKVCNNEAFVLGVSWPLSKPEAEGWWTITSQDYLWPATAHWVFSNFNIDRTRVFVGGFSAGGWAASQEGMLPSMRHISTHFIILSAGMRGKYRMELYKGSPVFIGVGTEGMNYSSAKAAKSKLESAGFDVTYVEAPGVGHAIGEPVWDGIIKWYKRFDPQIHAEEWLAEAEKLQQRQRDEACRLYAKVATLGPKDERGKTARRKLEELEGEALAEYEAAYDLLRARNYPAAAKAFADAAKEARKKRSARLLQLCSDGLAEVTEWQFCEQAMEMEKAFFTGRAYESLLLAQDGAMRYASSLKEWAQLFKSEAGKLTQDAMAAARSDIKRAKAQTELVKARIAVWTGGSKTKLEKAVEELEEIAKDFAGKPEGIDAGGLLQRIEALGE